jgi:hypothetical protein
MKLNILLLLTIMFVINLFPQDDLKSTLSKLSQDAAKSYLGPTVSAFGADLNSGWIHRVPKATIFGVDIEFGITAMGTFFSNENKTFSTNGTFRFTREEADQLVPTNYPSDVRTALINQLVSKDFGVGISGPTVVGSNNDSIKIAFEGTTLSSNGTSYTIPGKSVALPVTGYLEDMPVFPLAAPQLTIGTVYGTSVAIRYLPAITIDKKVGEFSYFGIGVQHNPAMWLPFPLPLEVSLGLFTQTMKLGDVFESKATTFGIFASKTFGPGAFNVTPYAGISYESSSSDIAYDFVVESAVPGVTTTEHISFNAEGENSARMIIGAAFKLGFLSLNVDYNIAKYSVVSGGLSFIF